MKAIGLIEDFCQPVELASHSEIITLPTTSKDVNSLIGMLDELIRMSWTALCLQDIAVVVSIHADAGSRGYRLYQISIL